MLQTSGVLHTSVMLHTSGVLHTSGMLQTCVAIVIFLVDMHHCPGSIFWLCPLVTRLQATGFRANVGLVPVLNVNLFIFFFFYSEHLLNSCVALIFRQPFSFLKHLISLQCHTFFVKHLISLISIQCHTGFASWHHQVCMHLNKQRP